MKKSVSLGVVLSAVVCLAYGCGGDDDDTSSPHAGSAGKAGSGAKGGAGGSSGKGGQGGTAGSKGGQGGTAGKGGKGGQGGTAGKGGQGGTAGKGGNSGGGGDGGYCANEQPSAPLAECPALGGDAQRTVDTTCSFEDTCRALDCGGTWSQFTEGGCRKPTCGGSGDCASDERCVSPLLVGNWDCFPSIYEGCEVSECSCYCSYTEDCTHPTFCQPASELTEPFDCPSVGCLEIETFVSALESYTSGLDPDNLSDADKSAIACQRKARRELDGCNGGGGAGAGGQGGAGAGSVGQSGGGQGGG